MSKDDSGEAGRSFLVSGVLSLSWMCVGFSVSGIHKQPHMALDWAELKEPAWNSWQSLMLPESEMAAESSLRGTTLGST